MKKQLLSSLFAIAIALLCGVYVHAQDVALHYDQQNQNFTEKVLADVAPAPALTQAEASKKSSFDRLLEFKKLATEQKSAWMDYMADETAKKAALINKDHQTWSDFHQEQLTKLNNLTDWSNSTKEAFFKEKLEAALTLYKENCAEWETLGKNQHEQAKKLSEKQKADFEAQFGQKKANKVDTVTQEKTSLEPQIEDAQKSSSYQLTFEEMKPSNDQEFAFDDNFDDDAELE